MNVHTLQRAQRIERRVEQVFAFFADAGNLDLLTPPWLRFEILSPRPIPMHVGALITYSIRWHGLRLRWLTRIEEWEPGRRFVDAQLRGPYRLWHHTHEFHPDRGGTLIVDQVRYALALGPLGRLAHTCFVRRDVERIFDYRAARIASLLGTEA